MSNNGKEYGEFECPKCDAVFFNKKSYNAHLGIHSRGTPEICKFCKMKLTDKNWLPSLKKQSNRTCKKCLKLRNRKAYMNRKKKKMEDK